MTRCVARSLGFALALCLALPALVPAAPPGHGLPRLSRDGEEDRPTPREDDPRGEGRAAQPVLEPARPHPGPQRPGTQKRAYDEIRGGLVGSMLNVNGAEATRKAQGWPSPAAG
ncbi:MAG: hypothetical protein U0599_26980 [Vicinamibacteria bacterium]